MMDTTQKSERYENDGNGTVARTVDQASSTAHKAIDAASNAAAPTVDKIFTGAHQAVDKVAGAATTAAETLDIKGDQLLEAQTRFTESCRAHVRDNPIASLGLAVAAGFVLNWWLRQR